MPDLSTGHVFMSYSRRDDAVMRRIVTFLRQQGIKVWVDNEKLIPGTPVWEVEIEKAIKSAPAIVVVLSPDSKGSEWVRREISLADQYQKRVFPVLVRGDEESSISLRLIGRQYVDIRKYEDAGLNYVSASLLRYLEDLELQEQKAQKDASRLAAQKTRTEKRLAKQKAEEERLAHEKSVGQVFNLTDESENRLAAQKAEEERIARENAEAERKAKVEIERLAAQKVEDERIVRENAETERKAKIEADRLAVQKAEEERIAREKAETERKAKIEVERLAAQKRESERNAKEKLEADNRLRVAREKEEFTRKNAEIYNRSREAAAKATQALLSKLKIPVLVLVLVLVVGFVVYLLWRGITSLQMQTAVRATIAAQEASMSTAEMIVAQETSISAAETMVVIQTESARPTETMTPTLEPEPGSIMTSEGDGATLVYVPAGEFKMGNGDSNAPIHTVYLDAFYIDQFEVTNKQYQACVGAGTCEPPSSKSSSTHPSYYENPEFDNYPVLYVNWDKANRYCEVWAGGDLPNEAQWEKAASWDETTQTQRIYPWGDSIDCNHANYQSGCVGDTSTVGSYDSGKSPYGAYDMAGNVWEWVNDYYQSDYYADNASNPQGPTNSEYRVLRGGAWNNSDSSVRSAFRFRFVPTVTFFNFGFRCARSLP